MTKAKTSEVTETVSESSEAVIELDQFVREHKVNPLMVAFYKAIAESIKDKMTERTEKDWQETFDRVSKMPVK